MAESLASAELDATHVAAATATHIDDEDKVKLLQAQLERCNVASARIQSAVLSSRTVQLRGCEKKKSAMARWLGRGDNFQIW